MLVRETFINPVPGIWGTFDNVRPALEKQETDLCPDRETGLSADKLKECANELEKKYRDFSPVIRKARIFEFLLLNSPIAIDPLDWFADKFYHSDILHKYNNRQRKLISETKASKSNSKINRAVNTGFYEAELDLGHTSPGWRFMYSKGLSGLLLYAEEKRKAYGDSLTQDQADFYDSLSIVYNAVIAFAARLSDYAATLLGKGSASDDIRLLTIADSLSHVPKNPPRDFHEALQFSFIMHQMIEMEGEYVRSMSGFDRCFFPYYDKDINEGRLTEENAKELIKFYWTKFFAHTKGVANGKNFYFGGQSADGSNAENSLTFAALQAYAELGTTDPKLSVRFFKGSSDRFMNTVADIIRKGQTSFVLINDETAIPAIMSQGKSLEEAREYLLIGCYEPAIEGLEIACNMSIKINLAKNIELVLFDGYDFATGIKLGPDTGNPRLFLSYRDFENAFLRQLDHQIEEATGMISDFELYWPEINPSPVLAGTFIDALDKGCDIGQAGPKFNNTGCMGGALANSADSLLAVKKLVYDDKICDMDELINAIKADFTGYEDLRLYILNRIPKWGNGNQESDIIAAAVSSHYAKKVNSINNNRGGRFVPSMFTLQHRFHLGKHTCALPDGRLSGAPLALNLSASPAMDKEGVTAQILSSTSINFKEIPNGSVTDIYLHPSAVEGQEGLAAFIALIRTYFARGGFGIQFNIFDTSTLIDAQKHPEKYSTLQIRVCGWNVYFVSLSPAEQKQYILSNIHRL